MAELREAQSMALSLPNTGMIVTIDVGEAPNIHPKDKVDVGSRLALTAEKLVYGQNVACSGPVYHSMSISGDKVIVTFDHAEGGLKSRDGSPPRGFALAGPTKLFYPADASIVNNIIVLHSDKVTNPVAVRYGWEDAPVCNLYNSAGLPASPFRTDDWPGISVGKR